MFNRREEPLPKNDPRLMRQTNIRAIRSFSVRGMAIVPDEIVEVEWHVARDMVSINKASWVNEQDGML